MPRNQPHYPLCEELVADNLRTTARTSRAAYAPNEDCVPPQPERGTLAGRQSEIAQALDRLDYAVEGAQEAFSVLDGRLGTVLHPPIPASSDTVNRTPPLVPLAADIERYADRINALVYELNHLTQRLGL